MSQSGEFGPKYIQGLLDGEIALAKPMGIEVESADDRSVVLRAPLGANGNHMGTAFGGSQYALSVLAGWAWLTRFMASRGIDAHAVIQEATTHYLAPVNGELRACLMTPPADEVEKFRKMLERAGRGRIRLRVEMQNHETLATLFDGVFAATLRR
jgi:thioesterase domain-containing protein